MGVRNKQRRREKAKRRAEHAKRQASRAWHDSSGPTDHGDRDRRRIREALWDVSGLRLDGQGAGALTVLLADADLETVAAEAEAQLAWLIGEVWHHGWQPNELVRYARRGELGLGRVIATLIVVDHVSRDPATLHPQWADQVEAINGAVSPQPGWLQLIVAAADEDRRTRVLMIVMALEWLATLGTLPTILPPPGAGPSSWNRSDLGPSDDPVLAKVRALLAQAESTTFEAEAEAFTAKAQELMARHAIDAALLWSRSGRSDRPVTIRLPIDDPYADQKAHLLHVVAEHSRCKAVQHADYGLQSVVGFATDVAATEVLFTSLLVQSHAAMLAEAASAAPGSHTRGRAFRSSFLLAFACRIDKRLAEVNESVEGAVIEDSGSSLLPVLAARAGAIDEEIATMFGKLTTSRSRGASDRLGWERGVLAADRAQLRPDLPSAVVQAP